MNLFSEKEQDKHKKYSYDVAHESGLSEGDLIYSRLGKDVELLDVEDVKKFIGELEGLGEVKTVTRNPYAVSVQTGEYTNQHLYGYKEMDVSAQAGLVLNPRKLDLRIFFKHWQHIFYILDSERGRSLHIFDSKGVAIHKIYQTNNTNIGKFDRLVEKYKKSKELELSNPFFSVKDEVQLPHKIDRTFYADIDQAWREMRDVHDFYILMHRFKKTRLEMLQAVKEDLAYPVSFNSVDDVLKKTHNNQVEITLFVANSGCVQIFTGVPNKIFKRDDWLNVFNDKFSLHVKFQDIAHCWIVKKPIDCGYATSLEVYSKEGVQILQIYGQRDEETPELETWREVISQLEKID